MQRLDFVYAASAGAAGAAVAVRRRLGRPGLPDNFGRAAAGRGAQPGFPNWWVESTYSMIRASPKEIDPQELGCDDAGLTSQFVRTPMTHVYVSNY